MSGERQYVREKIDEASQGFTACANLFEEARTNNKGLDILVEARGVFLKIMALASVLKADHVEALEALESGIVHTQKAFDAMQDVGDFTRPDDENSMMTYTQRALREADEAKHTTEASLSKYDDELSKDTWGDDLRFLDQHKESLGGVARFLDETIDKHQEVLTALANYKSHI